MAKRTLEEALNETLAQGETALASEHGQFKRSGPKQVGKDLAKDVAVSAAVTAVTSAFGFGVGRYTTGGTVWIVVTESRMLLFEFLDSFGKKAGDLIAEFPLPDIVVTSKSKGLAEIAVDDRATGENILRFNFGLRKRAHAAIVAAVSRD